VVKPVKDTESEDFTVSANPDPLHSGSNAGGANRRPAVVGPAIQTVIRH
jgi:hypothetical protein